MREGSMVVRQSVDTTIALITSKALWCQVVHSGKFLSQSLVVSSSRTPVCIARLVRKAARYCTRLRKAHTCLAHDGQGQFLTRSAFPSSALIPFAVMRCLRKQIS